MTPITDCMKKRDFNWTKETTRAFEQIQHKMIEAPISKLLDFNKAFKVSCDASQEGIGGVLSQNGHPVAYFSEKSNESCKKYSPYDLKKFMQ